MRQIVTTDDQVSILQARVVDLETNMQRRVAEARSEGEAAVRAQAQAQVQPLLGQLAKSIQDIAELRAKLRHEAETDLIKLSLAIAKKVLHREVSVDSEALSGIVRVAMEKIRLQDVLCVRINPQHHAVIQQMIGRLSHGSKVELIADARQPVGGVVIETTRGEFDASLDTQLAEIERGLVDRLASHA